jgi:ABC-type sulfate transport system permease component
MLWAAAAVAGSRIVYYLFGLRFAVITFYVPWRRIAIGHAKGALVALFGLGVAWACISILGPGSQLVEHLVLIVSYSLVLGLIIFLGPNRLVGHLGEMGRTFVFSGLGKVLAKH